MDLLIYVFALLFGVLGVVGAIVPAIPGALFSFLALLVAFFCSMPPVTVAELFLYLAIAVAVSVADATLPLYFTKRFGGSRMGVWGATIGMFVGFVSFPPIGFLICPLFGAVLGELMHDKTDVERAFKVGWGVFIAFLVGTGIKFIFAIWVMGLLIVDIAPAVWSFFESLILSFK
ncbi:MAG: DUF456 domain-containing protein [Rikenellaceae bacterium]